MPFAFSFSGGAGGGSSQPNNPDITYEDLGFGADGALTLVTSGGTNHTKGSYTTIGTTANAWCGFYLELGEASTPASRLLIDIAFGAVGSEVIVFPNLFLEQTAGNSRVKIPLQVPSGTRVSIRSQSNNASLGLRCALLGAVATTALAPGFTTVTQLTTPDFAITRASTTAVTPATTATYTEIVTSTASNYGALMVTPAVGSGFAVAQQGTLITATGGAGSESPFAHQTCRMGTTSPYLQRASRMIEKSIASGTRLSCAILAPAADVAGRVAIHGFS